jgi:hypothetical protein
VRRGERCARRDLQQRARPCLQMPCVMPLRWKCHGGSRSGSLRLLLGKSGRGHSAGSYLSESPETRTGCTGTLSLQNTSSIPARARAAALAPRMRRHRAHHLRLDVGTHSFIGSMSQSSVELVLDHVATTGVAPCRGCRAHGRPVGRGWE